MELLNSVQGIPSGLGPEIELLNVPFDVNMKVLIQTMLKMNPFPVLIQKECPAYRSGRGRAEPRVHFEPFSIARELKWAPEKRP